MAGQAWNSRVPLAVGMAALFFIAPHVSSAPTTPGLWRAVALEYTGEGIDRLQISLADDPSTGTHMLSYYGAGEAVLSYEWLSEDLGNWWSGVPCASRDGQNACVQGFMSAWHRGRPTWAGLGLLERVESDQIVIERPTGQRFVPVETEHMEQDVVLRVLNEGDQQAFQLASEYTFNDFFPRAYEVNGTVWSLAAADVGQSLGPGRSQPAFAGQAQAPPEPFFSGETDDPLEIGLTHREIIDELLGRAPGLRGLLEAGACPSTFGLQRLEYETPAVALPGQRLAQGKMTVGSEATGSASWTYEIHRGIAGPEVTELAAAQDVHGGCPDFPTRGEARFSAIQAAKEGKALLDRARIDFFIYGMRAPWTGESMGPQLWHTYEVQFVPAWVEAQGGNVAFQADGVRFDAWSGAVLSADAPWDDLLALLREDRLP